MEPIYIVLIILGALALLVEIYFLIVYKIFTKIIKKHENSEKVSKIGDNLFYDVENYNKFLQENTEIIKKIPFERLYIKSFDNLKLCGYFYKGKPDTTKTIICVHGYCSTPFNGYSAIGQYYIEKGYNVLMTNNRAHVESEGNYIGFGALDRYDIQKWTYEMQKKFPNCDIYLHGVSMGGGTVLMTSNLDLPKNVKGIIDDCGFTSPYEVFKRQIPLLFKIPAQPLLSTLNLYTKLLAKYDLKTSAVDSLKESKIPTIFIHGKKDIFVFPDMSKTNYDACSAPYKKLYLFDDAGHSGCYMKDKAKFIKAIEELFDYNDKKENKKAI